MGLIDSEPFTLPRVTTLLPQPAEHYRMTYCAGCHHTRAEHIDDGVCSKCWCDHMCVRVGPVTAGQWRAITGELLVMLSRLEREDA